MVGGNHEPGADGILQRQQESGVSIGGIRAIADAAAASLPCVCVEAELLSALHHHLLGLGLKVVFVRALWTSL